MPVCNVVWCKMVLMNESIVDFASKLIVGFIGIYTKRLLGKISSHWSKFSFETFLQYKYISTVDPRVVT